MKKANSMISGFTLSEVMVASMAFVVIFTGLAGLFQAGVLMSKAGHGTSACIRHYKDGIRLLWEGDNTPLLPPPISPQEGIARAIRARVRNFGPLVERTGRLEYRTPAGFSYQVWVGNGTLLRQQIVYPWPPGPPVPLAAPKILMGDPGNRIVVAPNTSNANPVASLPGDIPPGNPNGLPNSLVRFSFQIFQDFDGDGLTISGNEPICTFSSSIFLRNSE